ncbi:hypothetical protein BJP34_07970 [Moorena producens PAL-8-15-08-1]|uniref:Uncharacterized protein n=2 Tax=Moorena TaxID=1155738 RepID=A0A1D8TP18_9CYAN|nr:hypothetical protein BJP34_07970 [Moorena producens PAL-8-15-08-1]
MNIFSNPLKLKFIGVSLLVNQLLLMVSSIALAYDNNVDSDKLQVIKLEPGMQVTINYKLGMPGGNKLEEQAFSVYKLSSSDKSDGDDAVRLWRRSDEMNYIPFYYSNDEDKPNYLAIAYHAWSPSGSRWFNLAATNKKLVGQEGNKKTIHISYPKGGAANPSLTITLERDPLKIY